MKTNTRRRRHQIVVIKMIFCLFSSEIWSGYEDDEPLSMGFDEGEERVDKFEFHTSHESSLHREMTCRVICKSFRVFKMPKNENLLLSTRKSQHAIPSRRLIALRRRFGSSRKINRRRKMFCSSSGRVESSNSDFHYWRLPLAASVVDKNKI